jgi:protein tyrosine/serine phosphatase
MEQFKEFKFRKRGTMNKTILTTALCLGAIITFGAEKRPEKWAKPIKLAGVPNFHEIDSKLYRSAQPTAEGMKKLKKYGIKTVINLRNFHSDKDEVGKLKLKQYRIKINTWHLKDEHAIKFLKIVSNPKNHPVLVHCKHGADRTGTMCAVYRITLQRWSKKDAIKEMRDGGYNYHPVWKNLIKWLKKTDMKKLKKQAIKPDAVTKATGHAGK